MINSPIARFFANRKQKIDFYSSKKTKSETTALLNSKSKINATFLTSPKNMNAVTFNLKQNEHVEALNQSKFSIKDERFKSASPVRTS